LRVQPFALRHERSLQCLFFICQECRRNHFVFLEKNQVVVAGKQPDRVRARSVLAYWAIRDLGLTATEIGKCLGLSKSTVSRAANRGQKLIVDQFLSLKG